MFDTLGIGFGNCLGHVSRETLAAFVTYLRNARMR
jgi:hypothetical protein